MRDDETGELLRMGGTSQDITERKDAEQALALLTSMATAANEATSLADVIAPTLADIATHTGWRPVAAWLVGEDDQLIEVLGGGDGIPPEDVNEGIRLAHAAVAERAVQVSLTTEGTRLVAAPVVAEDRAACVIVMDTRATTPPTDTDGVTVGRASAIIAHVAERDIAAARLERARDSAMSASVAKSEFLATMSHEIRTPLNGVIGLSELLGRTELTTQQRRLADGIDSAGRSLLALVNDILDLSKIEAGRLELEAVDFDPTAVVEQSTTLMAERARAKGLELAVACQPDIPATVCGDPVRLGQVISNLTSNAVKFTSSGEVVVRASIEPDDGPGSCCGSRSATPARASPPRSRGGSSRPSRRVTARRPASTAAPGSGSRSAARSSPRWAARSASTASRARAAPSGSPPAWRRPPVSTSRRPRRCWPRGCAPSWSTTTRPTGSSWRSSCPGGAWTRRSPRPGSRASECSTRRTAAVRRST